MAMLVHGLVRVSQTFILPCPFTQQVGSPKLIRSVLGRLIQDQKTMLLASRTTKVDTPVCGLIKPTMCLWIYQADNALYDC